MLSNRVWVTFTFFKEKDRRCQCMQVLSAYGAQLNVADEDGNSPLHLAAAAGHTDACVFLAQRGTTSTHASLRHWTATYLGS